MPIDRSLLAEKLKRYREQFQISLSELSENTGINEEILEKYENAEQTPTGDEILILSDFYKCDFKFFISNERIAPFEQTEKLFRKFGDEFSKQDRWAIQEVLFLAENEFFLSQSLEVEQKHEFKFQKSGTFFKKHGTDAARELRKHFNYEDHMVSKDVYKNFREIRIHVFRRKLINSNISGLYIKHPVAGKCILINYNEDIYRQRFTAAHEAAHAILHDKEDVVVSFVKWKKDDLVEIRANTFASHYLMPPNFLKAIPESQKWNSDKAINWANKLKVSTKALANALNSYGLIDKKTENLIKSVIVPREAKSDPELEGLSTRSKVRKEELLKLGLSSHYVNLCFKAYHRNIISFARMAEIMLSDESKLLEIAELFREELKYGC